MSAGNGKQEVMPEKRKVGRPKVLPPDLNDRLMVRCSEVDKERWTERALKLGFSGASQWLRKIATEALKQPVK